MPRLPIPNSDAGQWGQILNDYLSAAHKEDGTLKDNSIGSTQLQPNSITEAILAPTVVTKLNTIAGQQGATGPSGATGATGQTGATGASGTPGTNGATGATGASGTPGTQGTPGATGSQGLQGIQGQTGATGATGAPSTIPGPTGATGPQGPQGEPGPAATIGSTGATGAPGQTGATGPQGIQGEPGPASTQGATGSTGATGTPGAHGATGATGQGVPTGGTTGQVLAKSSNANYATEWVAQSGGAPTYANLPAGTTITVAKSGGTWPARPTARNDIIVQWKGPDPSPSIVSSGTGGMLDNVDMRFVTPS